MREIFGYDFAIRIGAGGPIFEQLPKTDFLGRLFGVAAASA
jgi:hypothetical protein